MKDSLAETKKATELTRRSVEEAARSNTANEVLTVASNALTRDATELTRQSFLLVHRPKLNIRSIVPKEDFGGDRVPEGTFRIVNDGGTPARIERIFVTGKLYGFPVTKILSILA